MDKLMLSDKALNQQICSECLKYLSVGPVLVSCEGKILCGRCNGNKSSATKMLQHSLYNLVAQKLVFKCINHYAGCEELLFFNEAIEHEKICQKNGTIVCPFCEFDGSGCQLIHHFELEHPGEAVNEDDAFKITISDKFSKKIVFIKNSRIICMTICVGKTSLEIYNLLVGPVCIEREYFALNFLKFDSNIQFVTPPIQITDNRNNFSLSTPLIENVECRKNCYLLHHSEIIKCFPSGWCLCKVKLIDELNSDFYGTNYCDKIVKKINTKLPTNFLETGCEVFNSYDFNFRSILEMSVSDLRKFVNSELYLPEILCNICKRSISLDSLYFCSKYHTACKSCTTKKCPKCRLFCEWTNKPIIHSISLRCEWNDCLESISIFAYTKHKRDCKFRQYKCPNVECFFVGTQDSLMNHWHLTPIRCSPSWIRWESQRFYWLNEFNEMFHVIIDFEDISSKFSVTISEVDVVAHNKYAFKIKIDEIFTNFTISDFVKTQSDLPCGKVSTSFVTYLYKMELKGTSYLTSVEI